MTDTIIGVATAVLMFAVLVAVFIGILFVVDLPKNLFKEKNKYQKHVAKEKGK